MSSTPVKKRSEDLDGLLKNNSTPFTSVTPSSNIASDGKDTENNRNEQKWLESFVWHHTFGWR